MRLLIKAYMLLRWPAVACAIFALICMPIFTGICVVMVLSCLIPFPWIMLGDYEAEECIRYLGLYALIAIGSGAILTLSVYIQVRYMGQYTVRDVQLAQDFPMVAMWTAAALVGATTLFAVPAFEELRKQYMRLNGDM